MTIELDINRPLVTFALFAFEQERYVREAVEAALKQTYSPLQIILSDDCSNDLTFEIIKEIVRDYEGQHQILINRNRTNLGISRHIEAVTHLAKGDLIVTAAGDDISMPDRVSVMVSEWRKTGYRSGSIFSSLELIDEFGAVKDASSCYSNGWSADLESNDKRLIRGVYGCSHAWTKDLIMKFGPYDTRILHEDFTLPLRAALIGSVTYVQEPCVRYRKMRGSLSRPAYLSAEDRFAKMRTYWCGRVAVFAQFDKDVQLALANGYMKKHQVQWLVEALAPERRTAEYNLRFLTSGFLGRLSVIAISFRKVPFYQSIKWVVLTIWPGFYIINSDNFDILKSRLMNSKRRILNR